MRRCNHSDDDASSIETPGILPEAQPDPASLVEETIHTVTVVVFGRRPLFTRIDDVEATGRDLTRVLRRASLGVVVSYVTVIKRPSGDLGKGYGSGADLLPALKTIRNCGSMAGGGIAESKT